MDHGADDRTDPQTAVGVRAAAGLRDRTRRSLPRDGARPALDSVPAIAGHAVAELRTGLWVCWQLFRRIGESSGQGRRNSDAGFSRRRRRNTTGSECHKRRLSR